MMTAREQSAATRYVTNRRAPEWGIGRVVDETPTTTVIRFENVGTKVLARHVAELDEVPASAIDSTSALHGDGDKRSLRTSKSRVAELGVAFVNIGWSEKYDGGAVSGGHAWLNNPEGAEQHGSTEEALFVPRADGRYHGPLGTGAVPDFVRLDVVYVASPPTGGKRIVAVYRHCRVEAHHVAPQFLMVSATDVTCLSVRKRPAVTWPGKMSMRRWAVGGASKNWQELYDAYAPYAAA